MYKTPAKSSHLSSSQIPPLLSSFHYACKPPCPLFLSSFQCACKPPCPLCLSLYLYLYLFLIRFLHFCPCIIIFFFFLPDIAKSDLCNYNDDSNMDDVTPKKYKLDECILSSRECNNAWDYSPVRGDMGYWTLMPSNVLFPTKLIELENVVVVFLQLNPIG